MRNITRSVSSRRSPSKTYRTRSTHLSCVTAAASPLTSRSWMDSVHCSTPNSPWPRTAAMSIRASYNCIEHLAEGGSNKGPTTLSEWAKVYLPACVSLPVSGPAVGKRELAVAADGGLQPLPFAGIGGLQIRDHLGAGVISAGRECHVHLPHAFDALDLGHGFPSGRLPSLLRTVVHDDNLRLQRPYVCGCAGKVAEEAMMGGLHQRDRSELIQRASQLHLLVPGPIAQVEKGELAEGEQEAEAALIFSLVGILLLRALAERVRTAVIDRLRYDLSIR